jgi:hypothetical protein
MNLPGLPVVVAEVKEFSTTPLQAAARSDPAPTVWQPPTGPWIKSA